MPVQNLEFTRTSYLCKQIGAIRACPGMLVIRNKGQEMTSSFHLVMGRHMSVTSSLCDQIGVNFVMRRNDIM